MNIQALEYALPLTWEVAPVSGNVEIQVATVEPDFLASPTWELEVDRKLEALMAFPHGWDGQGAGAISRAMASYVRSILTSVMSVGSPVPSLVPAHGGAVQLEWHQGGLDIELMIYRLYDAELSVSYHDGRGPIEEQPLSTEFGSLSEALSELG